MTLQEIINQKDGIKINQMIPLLPKKFSCKLLNKNSAELFAIGTGLFGIIFTLQDIAINALVMDTVSAIAAIAAFITGIGHLSYFKNHELMRRGVRSIGIGAIMLIAIIVWLFGFRLHAI